MEAPDLQMGHMPDIFNSPFYRQYTLDSLNLANQQKNIFYTYKPKSMCTQTPVMFLPSVRTL
ncbi:MAG: hypothetical protein WDM78_14855 [Puia sp.]